MDSIDPESTLYLKKLTEDWAHINLVQPKIFSPVKNIIVNKKKNDEIWIKTTCNISEKIDWLADTGSPRNFIKPTMANIVMTQNPNVKIEKYNENKCSRCFKNKEIKIKGVILMDITFGSWFEKNMPNSYSGTKHDKTDGTRRTAKTWNQPTTNKTTRQNETETSSAPQRSIVDS